MTRRRKYLVMMGTGTRLVDHSRVRDSAADVSGRLHVKITCIQEFMGRTDGRLEYKEEEGGSH